MKQYFLLLFFACSYSIAGAQATTPEFFQGVWNTSNTAKFTRLTVSPNLTNQVYRIDCSTVINDADILQFNIYVDGVVQTVSFYEGSSVLVEGKDIALQQVNPGAAATGIWRVVQKPAIAPVTANWVGYSKLNKDILVASLKTEQEFILHISHDLANCTASTTGMNVYIDGVPVKDRNNVMLTFAAGNSMYGKGKVITIRPLGICTGNNVIAGTIKLKSL